MPEQVNVGQTGSTTCACMLDYSGMLRLSVAKANELEVQNSWTTREATPLYPARLRRKMPWGREEGKQRFSSHSTDTQL